MSRQGLRPIAVTLSLLLLTAGPAQASPIRFADVIAQAIATGQRGRQTFDLSLRTLPQSGRTDTTSNTQAQNPTSGNTGSNGQTQTSAPAGGTGSVTNTEVRTTQGQSGNVEVVELGDVTGTICDCGEIIPLLGHGFPKLPFLALAGIPLLFIPHGNDTRPETPPPPPTPPPTPTPTTPVPEPATLLLLGSGLIAFGAGARRRRAAQARQQVAATIAGEV